MASKRTSESPPSVRRGIGGPGRFSSVDSEYSKEYCIYLWSFYAKYLPRFVRRSILGTNDSLALFPKLDEQPNIHQSSDAQRNGSTVNGGADSEEGVPSSRSSLDQSAMAAQSFAAVAIIDVTGFTTLTTKAGRAGTLGEDVLHRFMNSYFAQVLEMVSAYGGDVLHFAGDAMIVVFLPTEDEKKSATMKEDVCYRSVYCIQSIVQKYGCVKITRHGDVEMVDEEEMVGVQLNEQSKGFDGLSQPEGVLSCRPESSVDGDGDDSIDRRIQHSLERIDRAFRKKGLWFDQPDVPLCKGVWLPDVIASSDDLRHVQGSRGLDVRLVSQLLRDAQSRTLEIITRLSGVYHPQQTMEKRDSALKMLYKGEEFVMREELACINQLVYLKGMVSCGDVEFYRIGGNFRDKMESVSEVIMVDKGMLQTDSFFKKGPLGDFIDMDQVIRPNQALVSEKVASLLDGKIFGKRVEHRGVLNVLAVKPPSSAVQQSLTDVDAALEEEESILERMSEELCQQALNALVAHIPTPIKSMTSETQGPMGVNASRVCSIMFFGFPSLNLFTTLESVQSVFAIVQKHLALQGSAVLQMRNDEKGFVLIGGYGLPGHSKGSVDSPADTAAVSALDILDALDKEGFHAKAGITTGYVMCASIGSELRCEYSVFGDTVNLAARLMVLATKSEYSILCDEETYSMCSSNLLDFSELQPLPIKGFLEYKNIFSIRRVIANGTRKNEPIAQKLMHPTSETPYKHFLEKINNIFVGRQEYVKKILSHVELLRQGVGSTVNITGFTGVGKTALFNHVFRSGLYREIGEFPIQSVTLKESIWGGFQSMLDEITKEESLGIDAFKALRDEDISSLQIIISDSLQIQQESVSTRNLSALLSLTMFQGRISEAALAGSDLLEHTDMVAELLLSIVHAYAELKGPYIFFIDNVELAPPVIWRLAKRLIHSGLPVLLILSLRWSQFIFQNTKNWMNEADSPLSERESVEDFIGFDYYRHKEPIESIQSPLLRDFFSTVLDDSITTLAMRDLSRDDVREFISIAFPGLSIDGQLLHSILAGHPDCLKLLCIFLYLYHQRRTEQQPSVGSLSALLLYQIRTFSPMWSRAQFQFDSIMPEGRHVGMHYVILGNTVPEQLLLKVCSDLPEEAVHHSLEVLEYVGYLVEHETDDGFRYWETKNPVIRQAILDMMPTSTKRDLRARVAMIFEQMYYNGELRFDLIGWYWRESCRAYEGILWRRALRGIAAFEDCACVQLEKENYALVEENLLSAVSLAMLLTESSVHSDIKPVPRWRIATWERCLAACNLMKEDFDAEDTALHCLKAITLLGDPLPWNYADMANNLYPKVFPKPSKLVASIIALGRYKRKDKEPSSIACLAHLGNPQWTIVDEGEDQHETIPELVGMTTSFLPSKGNTVADEILRERTYIVQVLAYIFESSGPWTPSSLEFLSKYCSFISSKSTSQKTIAKIRSVKSRLTKLAEDWAEKKAIFSLDSIAHPILTIRPSLNYHQM